VNPIKNPVNPNTCMPVQRKNSGKLCNVFTIFTVHIMRFSSAHFVYVSHGTLVLVLLIFN
jgi:hypothetical protein